MALHESGEMYLEAIYVLSKKLNNVRSIDVSEYLNYSKPSVSRAISVLKNEDFVIMDEYGFLILTEKGLVVATKIYQRHVLLNAFLTHIGLDKETAAEDACKMEHAISDKTFDIIKEHSLKIGVVFGD
ncbi:MAG: metal-dependent transcriptional regulator [Clostridia bacterium]